MWSESIGGDVTPLDEKDSLVFGEFGESQIVDLARPIESIQVGVVNENSSRVVGVHHGEGG